MPNALDDTIYVLGMVHLLPAPTLHVFEGRSRVVMPTLIVPVNPALGIGGPGELADVVGELAKPQFAFAQGFVISSEYRFGALALGNLLGRDIDPDDFANWIAQRVPISDPPAILGYVRALARDLNASHRLTGADDGTDDAFDSIGQSRYAVANRTPQMIFN